MDKKERMALCKELCYKVDYTILGGDHEYPKHIRLNGIGDIWPTTGTLKLNGNKNFYKGAKGVFKLAETLGEKDTILHVKKGMRKEIDHLKKVISDQNAAIENLFGRLEGVEFLVNAPASMKAV